MQAKISKFLEKTKQLKNEIVEDFNDPNKKIRRKNRINKILVSSFIYAIVIGLGFIIVFPIVQQLIWGFHDPTQVNNPAVIYIPEL